MEKDEKSRLIKKLVLGGAGMGAGVGLGLSYVNHLNRLNKENEADNKRVRRFKAELEKALAEERSAEKQASGTAVTAGLASAAAAYMLSDLLYKHIEKKRIKEELHNAMDDYDTLLLKSASAEDPGRPMTTTEWLSGSVKALPLLVALGSAIAMNHYLNEHDPLADKRRRWSEDKFGVDDLSLKRASAEGVPELFKTASMILLETPSVYTSTLANMTGTILEGNGALLEDALRVDPTAALDGIAGAYENIKAASDVKIAAALGIIENNPVMAPVAGLFAAAEFADTFPRITKVALEVYKDPEDAESLKAVAGAASAESLKARLDFLSEEELEELLRLAQDSNVEENSEESQEGSLGQASYESEDGSAG